MSGCKRISAPRALILFAGLVLAITVRAPVAWGAEPFSVERADLNPADLPQSTVAALNGHGTRIFTYVNGLKMSICEIFWAQTAITQPNKEGSTRATYANLAPGSLLGVIRFLPEASEDYREDFHDQKLKAGYYTMRYAVLSGEDARDFLVLSPVNADRDPDRVLANEQLIGQSKLASHTGQPAILSLVNTEISSKDYPSLRMDESGTCILQDKLHAKSTAAAAGEVVLAVIVANPISEEDGS
jgi:hypothetical protein